LPPGAAASWPAQGFFFFCVHAFWFPIQSSSA
jgi:hypothetical protein